MFSRQHPQSSYYTQWLNDATLLCLASFVMQTLPAVSLTLPGTQVEQVNSFLKSAVSRVSASIHMDSRKAQISAALIPPYSSNGIMLPMLTWATTTSNHTAIGRSGEFVISVQMGTCIAGKQLSQTGAMAQAVRSAQVAKCASTTPWLPRLLRL